MTIVAVAVLVVLAGLIVALLIAVLKLAEAVRGLKPPPSGPKVPKHIHHGTYI